MNDEDIMLSNDVKDAIVGFLGALGLTHLGRDMPPRARDLSKCGIWLIFANDDQYALGKDKQFDAVAYDAEGHRLDLMLKMKESSSGCRFIEFVLSRSDLDCKISFPIDYSNIEIL